MVRGPVPEGGRVGERSLPVRSFRGPVPRVRPCRRREGQEGLRRAPRGGERRRRVDGARRPAHRPVARHPGLHLASAEVARRVRVPRRLRLEFGYHLGVGGAVVLLCPPIGGGAQRWFSHLARGECPPRWPPGSRHGGGAHQAKHPRPQRRPHAHRMAPRRPPGCGGEASEPRGSTCHSRHASLRRRPSRLLVADLAAGLLGRVRQQPLGRRQPSPVSSAGVTGRAAGVGQRRVRQQEPGLRGGHPPAVEGGGVGAQQC